MFENINSLIDTLSLDHRRGAAEIVRDTGELLKDIAVIGEDNPDGALGLFNRAIKRLAQGQPSMAPVLNLLNQACLARESSQDDWTALKIQIESLLEHRKHQLEQILGRLSELPAVDGTLLTFSNSSTVAGAIIECHKKHGLPRDVICSEARPVMEGLVLARKLTAARVPVTVYTDAALMSKIVNVEAVWVGGDSFSYKGLVNKVGSCALAMLARLMEIPFISLMGSDKLMPPEMMPFIKFLPQNPREIAPDAAEELNIKNEYYETIPVDLVSYVFTEEGLFEPNALVEGIQHQPVSRLFYDIVQS